MIQLARRHPALTLLGAAGLGLAGGFELAAGVVLGAGVAVLLRPRNGSPEASATAQEERTRLRRAPHELAERTRAVMRAALGKS
ncbi:MAG: hypothetical protein ACTHU0_27680 [Kofleriaceae bacterium]